jgi:hypothetical protein
VVAMNLTGTNKNLKGKEWVVFIEDRNLFLLCREVYNSRQV